MMKKARHFISINDLTVMEIKKILRLSLKLKKNPQKYSKAN